MKKWICGCLVIILTLLCWVTPAAAEAVWMGYTDADLARDDNQFSLSTHLTIGRENNGANNYAAQPFVPGNDPIVACKLYLRLGDNATVTLQIRSDLSDSPESILYSSDHPLVSNPHGIIGWWDFTLTRPVKLEAGREYYLVFWCDTFHSYCFAGTTQYVVPNLKHAGYRKPETTNEWGRLMQRCYGFALIGDPDAQVVGYPAQGPDDQLILHQAEEVYAFSRHAPNTTLAMDRAHMTQGYASMAVTGGARDENGRLFTAHVDFDSAADLTAYGYFYADVLAPMAITGPLTLQFELTDAAEQNGRRVVADAAGWAAGWRRLMLPLADAQAIGSGKVNAARHLTLSATGDQWPEGLRLYFDNLRLAKQPLATFTDGYYTEEQLAATEDVSDLDYVGKTPSAQGLTCGDPNEDRKTDAADALLVLKAAVKKLTPTGRQVKAGDVNGDAVLDARDALMILQRAVGKRKDFPVSFANDDPPTRPDFTLPTDGLTPGTLYTITTSAVYNSMKGVLPHDAVRLAASLQGLINRELLDSHIGLSIVDKYAEVWVPYMRQNSDVLAGMTNKTLRTFQELLQTFAPQLKACGMVVWDPDVPATANVAATACGLDGYLPVKYDPSETGLMKQLMSYGVPVKLDLTGMFTGKGLVPGTALLSSGSTKCDAYLWALEKYAARCSTDFMMYVPDGASATVGNRIYEEDIHAKSVDYNRLYNHDYGILRKAFFFDLTPIDIEAPCDDPDQPVGTDAKTLQAVLLNRYARAGGAFGEIVGFPPWWFKYATHNNWGSVEATSVESAFTEVITRYNCFMDADGSLTDCSLYARFPLKDHYEAPANHKPITETFDPNTMYLFMYTGDYDSSGWALEHLYRCYNNSERGSIPITWCVAPSLSRRIPMLFDYLYTHQTENDYFAAANSGAGYLRPQSLFQSESARTLPDGDRAWIKLNREYFSRFDMDAVGFLIGTLSDNVCRTYNQFAPVGSNTNDVAWTPADYVGTPYVRIKNGIGNPATTEEAMATTVKGMWDFAQSMKPYHTAGFRTITFTAAELKRTQEAFLAYAAEHDPDTTYRFVDYRTYFAMLHAANAGRYTLD